MEERKPTLAETDQALAMIADCLPAHWKSMYDGMLASGFTEQQAMILLIVYIQNK